MSRVMKRQPANMALQWTRRPRFRSGRSLRSLGSPLNAYSLGSPVILAVWLALCLWAGTSTAQVAHPTEVVYLSRDLDGDGIADRLSIRMTAGRRYVDRELWCGGHGIAKVEGTFEICTRLSNRQPRCTPLNPLLSRPPMVVYREGKRETSQDKLWFFASPWAIQFADYNHDGQLDFNLGQYGGCGGWGYTVLTIDQGGTVERLMEEQIFLFGASSNSATLDVTPTGFRYALRDGSRRDQWFCLEYTARPPDYKLRQSSEVAGSCPD